MLIQQGARRNYIYARQLHAVGLLHSVVTDAAWPQSGTGWAGRLALRIAPRLSRAMERRTLRGIPFERLRSTAAPNAAAICRLFVHEERAYRAADEVLSLVNRWRGLDGAEVVVNYQGNGGSFLDYAKSKGAKIVTDFVITPKYLEIERDETLRWPGWEGRPTAQSVIDFYWRRVSHLVQISDVYLCPSEAVARDLADLPGFVADRVRLVPYGVSGVLLHAPKPVPGRVLFAGAAGLRKGLPYLAQAATLLKASHPGVEIVVAGHASPAIASRAETRDLTFLGMLDRARMAEEFARADVFCLPSLAEGSATSVFEALANGLPVVTTHSSGSVVVGGREGLIVPERSGQAIADAIVRITGDRGLRQAMSGAAFSAATAYSDQACGETFIGVVSSLLAKRDAEGEVRGS
jgi:glycosyltransferase involved in cell wall biosynthesis